MHKTAVLALFGVLTAQAASEAAGVRSKFELIESGRAPRGAVISFSAAALNAWVREELPTVVPSGVRDTDLQLGEGTAIGSALIDFVKVGQAKGLEPPLFLSELLGGEKRVVVNARIESQDGMATVFLERVELGGVAVSGKPLQFLIQAFFLPLFPNAKIGRPFRLADGMDRIEVQPGVARAVMKK